MKGITKIIASLLFVAVMAVSQSLYADTATQADDAQVASLIKSGIASDASLSGLNINVTSTGGTVTLSGNVDTDAQASKIIEIASATPGANDVVASNLIVKDSNQPFADTVITAKVKGSFVRDSLTNNNNQAAVPMMSVNVETKNGVVFLSGTVESQQQADNAIKIAKSINGVQSVESTLKVAPPTAS